MRNRPEYLSAALKPLFIWFHYWGKHIQEYFHWFFTFSVGNVVFYRFFSVQNIFLGTT